MLTAVVTEGHTLQVHLVEADEGEHEMIDISECEFPKENPVEGEYPCEEGPNPILPEVKEMVWGGGAFLVLAVLMRLWLYPALKKGMDERYASIRDGHQAADSARAAARAEVAQYESSLATVKAEANERVDAARQTLESERVDRLAEVNAAISAKRDVATREAAAARESISGQISAAVVDVAARTLELTIGATPDANKVRAAVDAVMTKEAAS